MEARVIQATRLEEIKAKVACWRDKPADLPKTPQPPGSSLPPTRVATYGKQVASLSRLLRVARGRHGHILVPAHWDGFSLFFHCQFGVFGCNLDDRSCVSPTATTRQTPKWGFTPVIVTFVCVRLYVCLCVPACVIV